MPIPTPSTDVPLDPAALAWLARRHSGRWTADDAKAHAAWLAADPAHQAAWQRAEALWHELAGLHPFATPELHALRARPATTIGRRGWATVLALAGITALALGVDLLLPGSFKPMQTQQTAYGEHRTVMLPDGSRIEINTASRIDIEYRLGCRCIRLPDGEAIFHVAHGDPRPFKVSIPQGTFRDIGTVFWVRKQAQRLDVAVLEGEIEFAPRNGTAARALVAGDRLALNSVGESLPTTAGPLDDLLAWRKGALVFRDAPLTDVITEFARYHEVNIAIDNRLARYHLSGRLPSDDLDGLLALIRSAYPVEVNRPAPGRLNILLKSSHG